VPWGFTISSSYGTDSGHWAYTVYVLYFPVTLVVVVPESLGSHKQGDW
jgi:hypothetical protein